MRQLRGPSQVPDETLKLGFVHNRADFQHLYHGAYSGRPLGR
jgi:hypothetical protein